VNEIDDSKQQFNTQISIHSYESFISRTWSLAILSVALIGIFIAMWMLIYVIIKMCDQTLGGSQALGLLLLFSVILLFCSVIPWLLPPNETICATRHFLPPLALALNFSILLVKAMQLRSLIKVGLGGTIPQINQIVSLIFMLAVQVSIWQTNSFAIHSKRLDHFEYILITKWSRFLRRLAVRISRQNWSQVVISCEWYLTNSPIRIDQDRETSYPSCGVTRVRFVLLHTYPAVLLVLAFCFGVSVLKIKTNFHEGRWITAATISMMPVYVVWMLLCSFAPGNL